MNVFKIVVAPAVYAQLTLGNLTYSDLEEACDVVRRACKTRGWKSAETIKDDCVFFWNEHGSEIASVVPVDGPRWRKHSA